MRLWGETKQEGWGEEVNENEERRGKNSQGRNTEQKIRQEWKHKQLSDQKWKQKQTQKLKDKIMTVWDYQNKYVTFFFFWL